MHADDGAHLWTSVHGDGVPMVLCHGGPGLWDSLGSLAALVDDVAVVHRWDQRGGGRSARIGPYTVARMVADMEALREHAGVDRWVVAGHSWGALLAVHYATAHPETTLGLVHLCGPGLADSWATNRLANRAARAARLGAARLARLESLSERPGRTPAEEREMRLLSWLPEITPGLDAEALLAADLDAPWPIGFDANRELMADAAVHAPTVRAALPHLDVPALVVHGAHDTIPPAGAEELASLLPSATLVTTDTGHRPWLEAPDATAALLRPHLRSCA